MAEFVREDIGLLWAFQLFPEEPARPLESESARAWLANPERSLGSKSGFE